MPGSTSAKSELSELNVTFLLPSRWSGGRCTNFLVHWKKEIIGCVYFIKIIIKKYILKLSRDGIEAHLVVFKKMMKVMLLLNP